MGMDALAVRMIALDLDGTLLGADGRVGRRNVEALRAAEAAGLTVVIATGRRHYYAMKVLRGLGLSEDTVVVSSNGAVVRTFGSRLMERTQMQPGSARWLTGKLDEFRNALVVTFDKVREDGEDVRGSLVVEELAELHSSIAKWMVANEPYMLHVKPIEGCLKDEDEAPIQMMLCGTIERMRRAEAVLLAFPEVAAVGEQRAGGLIALNRTEYLERDLSLLDILPAGCSKGAALLRLAGSLGMEAEAMMAIGDNWNDLSMLEVAGHPVLMGNAPADLLAMAAAQGWHVTAPHDQDGVAEAVESRSGLLTASQGAGPKV